MKKCISKIFIINLLIQCSEVDEGDEGKGNFLFQNFLEMKCKYKNLISFIILFSYFMSGQQQLQKSKVFRFLEKLANSTSEVNSTEQKIIQHKIKRSRFLENRKKIQQAMKRQAEKLDMVKKEIDNIDCSIAELKNIMENNVNSAQDDMNVKQIKNNS